MLRKPNILITGTPCTGKTATATELCRITGLKHLEVTDLVKKNQFHDSWDEEYGCFVLDDDLLIDHMEPIMEQGGYVVDFHSPSIFPARWFDLVVVLRTDNSVLYSRMEQRGYTGKKFSDNLEAEIMQVILDDVRGIYAPEVIAEMASDTSEQLESNVDQIRRFIESKLSK